MTDVMPLQTISQLSLARGQKLCLVTVYGQKMLLTVSSERVEVLLHITRQGMRPIQTEGVTGNNIAPPPAPVPPQRNGDIYLNQNSLSAQKSMQRNQHFNREIATAHPVRVGQTESELTETSRENCSNVLKTT